MKVIIKKEKDIIQSVSMLDFYLNKGKSEIDVMKAIKRLNKHNEEAKFSIVDIKEESVSEIITYLLGEKKYKRLKNSNDMFDEFNSLKSKVEETKELIENLLQDIEYSLNDIERQLNIINNI